MNAWILIVDGREQARFLPIASTLFSMALAFWFAHMSQFLLGGEGFIMVSLLRLESPRKCQKRF
jgi:hypothetical protein